MAGSRAVLLVAALGLCFLMLADATSPRDCPATCLSPYAGTNKTHALPSKDCLHMCQVCLNSTSSKCTSYFLPYFYGSEYSKHFACWESCPLPTWAWIVIAVSVCLALLLTCHCIWYCAYRRKQNREAAMQMYQLTHGGNVHMVVEQAEYPVPAGPGKARPVVESNGSGRGGVKSSMQAVKNISKNFSKITKGGLRSGGAPQEAPSLSYIPPPPSPATLPPNPGFSVNTTRSVPRHEGGGWGVRTNPAYQKLEQAERDAQEAARMAALNPYSSARR